MSREKTLEMAMAILQEDGLDGFSMYKLAERLGSSVMASYNYFPNRDALLDAVSAEIFSQFKIPAHNDAWQEWLHKWIFALYDLFESYPVAPKLIRWNKRISPAWLRVWLPVIRMLATNGLAGKQLAFATGWLGNSIMGLITSLVESEVSLHGEPVHYPFVELKTDQTLLANLNRYAAAGRGKYVLKYGAAQIVAGLDNLFENKGN